MSEKLAQEDVVSIEGGATLSLSRPTFRVDEMTAHVVSHLARTPQEREWSSTGFPAKVLNSKTGGWRKGKVRLTIEFIPDEPEAPQ